MVVLIDRFFSIPKHIYIVFYLIYNVFKFFIKIINESDKLISEEAGFVHIYSPRRICINMKLAAL